MRRLFCVVISLFVFVNLVAQVQQGKVRTAGTLEQKGMPLEGVSVKMRGNYNSAVSDGNGNFAVVMSDKRNGDPISIDNIFKVGYELLDRESLITTYAFSSRVPLEIVMKSKSAIAAEQSRIEQRAYENAEKVYNRRINQLDSALAASQITAEQRRVELIKAQEQYNTFASLISIMSGRYARIDYDKLEGNGKEISKCIAEGNLMKADSLINLKGDIHKRVGECKADMIVIKEAEEQLLRTTRQFERKKESFLKVKNDLLEDLDSKYAIFLSSFQLDSACVYILERAELDTADISSQIQAASFLSKYSIDYLASERYIQRAINLIEKQYGNNHIRLADCFMLKGQNYEMFAEYEKAVAAYNDAITICKYDSENSESALYDKMLAYLNLGDLMCKIANFDAAKKSYNEVKSKLSILEESNHIYILRRYYNSMAHYSHSFMKYNDALEYIDSAIKLCETKEGYYSLEMAYSLNIKGAIYMSLKDYERAYECSIQVLEIRRKIYGDRHPEVATAFNNIGSVCDHRKKRDQALEYMERSLEINQSIFGEWHPAVATNCNNIASVLLSLKKYDEAMIYVNKALEINRSIYGENHENVANSYNNLANILYSSGNQSKACESILQSITIFEKLYGGRHDKVAIACTNYGLMAADIDLSTSDTAFKKAREIYASNYGEGSKKVAEVDFAAGFTFYRAKDYKRSYKYLKSAVDVFGSDGYDSFQEAIMLEDLSYVEANVNMNFLQAISYARLALDVYSKVVSPESRSAVVLRQNILSYYYRVLSSHRKDTDKYSTVLKDLKLFESNCMWQAFVPKDVNVEDAKGLTGDYWLVRYNEWDVNSIEYFGDVASRYSGKPKNLLLYKDGEFIEVMFEDKPSVIFACIPIDPELKDKILEKYETL